MDDLYDNAAAAQALDAIKKTVGTSNVGYALQDMPSSDLSSIFTIVKKDRPISWIIAQRGQTERVEVVHRIKGIITSKCLPPFIQIPRSSLRARHMKQGLQLTGLGLPYFDNLISNILAVFSMFDRHFSENELEKWEASKSAYGSAIYASNRLFTPSHSLHDNEGICVPPDWDPSGGIRKVVGGDLAFTDENLVLYYTQDDNKNYVEDTPSKFRVGDIVEMQVTPTVTPIGGGRYRMFVVLRSIALVNDTFSKTAVITRAMQQVEYPISTVPFKRVIGYAEDNLERKRPKVLEGGLPEDFSNMNIE